MCQNKQFLFMLQSEYIFHNSVINHNQKLVFSKVHAIICNFQIKPHFPVIITFERKIQFQCVLVHGGAYHGDGVAAVACFSTWFLPHHPSPRSMILLRPNFILFVEISSWEQSTNYFKEIRLGLVMSQ